MILRKNYASRLFLVLLVLSIFFIGLFVGKEGFVDNLKGVDELNVISVDELKGGNKITTNIVAVDTMSKGVSAKLITEMRDGSGLVLVNVNDVLADVNAQYSARTATQVAKEYANVSLEGVDFVFSIKTNASIVGGQSAGTAMTLSVLGLILEKEVNPAVVVTGAILENGSVGGAGAIYEKAKAAKKEGADLFLVPVGTGGEVVNYLKMRRCGDYGGKELCEVSFEENRVSIGKELGIDVVEIENVGDALEHYFV